MPVGSHTNPVLHLRIELHSTQYPNVVLQSMLDAVHALSDAQTIRHFSEVHLPEAQSISARHSTQRPRGVSHTLLSGQSGEVLQAS